MKINIAGVNININGEIYDYFKYRLRKYIASDDTICDITITYEDKNNINIPEGEIIKKDGFRVFAKNKNTYLQYDLMNEKGCSALIASNENWTDVKCELIDVEDLGGASLNIRQFNMIGMVIKYIMLNFSGMALHSSSISYKDSGIMFSANSGTGKSTHTRLWKKVFDDVNIVNDDMPIIRFVDNKWYLFGSPWSGKSEININYSVPLKALVFIERGTANEIEKIYSPDSVFRIIGQTFIPSYKESAKLAMSNITNLVENIPIYKLKCTISEEAPMVVAKELGLI